MGTAERKRKPSFIYVVIGALLLAAFVLLLTNLFFHPGVSQNIKKDVLSEDHFFSRVFASEERVDFFEEYVLSLDEDEKLLISCWATWCSPCLRDLTLLQ